MAAQSRELSDRLTTQEENGRRLITSVGLGTSILPVRFCSVPEIVSIEWR